MTTTSSLCDVLPVSLVAASAASVGFCVRRMPSRFEWSRCRNVQVPAARFQCQRRAGAAECRFEATKSERLLLLNNFPQFWQTIPNQIFTVVIWEAIGASSRLQKKITKTKGFAWRARSLRTMAYRRLSPMIRSRFGLNNP